MPVVLKVDGAGRLSTRLLFRKAGAKGWRASVGYSAPYSLFVHENLEAFHPVGKAKFLSGPVRRTAGQRREVIAGALKAGRTFYQAAVLAAHLLKRASQAEVPVDTGRLKSSAFVQVIKS